MISEAWPELPYEEWAPTKKTLQMCAQMLGKLRLALAPPQPEWLHTCLYLDARGFTTGAMPWASHVITAGIDVFDSALWIDMSDGRRSTVSIGPNRCVAEIWDDFHALLADLEIAVDIWEKPQELADTTPFSENRHDCTFDSAHARRFHRLLCTIDGVFEEFRSTYFGRSSIQYWWGASDFAVLLFTGKHLDAPDDRGYIMRYDLDAEHLNAGFWPGDDNAPHAGFFGYLVPRPDGCEVAPMEPGHAGWVEAMGEWIMPYEAVRTCDDPRGAVLDFLRSVYRVAVESGGWDAAAFTYTAPPAPRRD
jgi:hypothetical protein